MNTISLRVNHFNVDHRMDKEGVAISFRCFSTFYIIFIFSVIVSCIPKTNAVLEILGESGILVEKILGELGI